MAMAHKKTLLEPSVKRRVPKPETVRRRQAPVPARRPLPNLSAHFALALRRITSNRALRRLAEGESAVPPDLEARLVQEQGRGEMLEEGLRSKMESALGADLSAVRIHRDATANTLSKGLNARAFTVGADVYFASGEYAPETETGQHTLAHELTHVVQGHTGAALVVGSVQDPAEAEADEVANQVVKRLREEPAVVSRQAEEEEEEKVQSLRRQAEDEEKEEEVQTVRRQAVEMETMRDYEDELELSTEPENQEVFPLIRWIPSMPALRTVETAPSAAPRLAKSAERVRRRVLVDVTTETPSREALAAMTIVELREQIERLAPLGESTELNEPQTANLMLLEEELRRREAALEAASIEDLERMCSREMERFQFWMLSPGGLPLQTLRAFDIAIDNFMTNTEASPSEGIGVSDILGILLEAVPGIGPVARWIGDDAVRDATVAIVQAAIETTAEAIEGGVGTTTAEGEQRARATFAAQIRRESMDLADRLARSTDSVIRLYGQAIDAATRTRNASALRILLVNLQHENDRVRAVSTETYAEFSRQFEIELYKRYYQSRGYIHVIEHNVWGVMSREVRGIPESVQEALIRRLGAARRMLDLAYEWGLPERVTRTSGGPY